MERGMGLHAKSYSTMTRIMQFFCRSLIILVSLFGAAQVTTISQPLAADEPESDTTSLAEPFHLWLDRFIEEASVERFKRNFLESAFSEVQQLPRVIELDRRQAEFTQTFWRYFNGRVSDTRIREGNSLIKQHSVLLKSIEKKYGVQARFLVAFWGLETNYGQFLGGFPVINSLATLAHDGRRSTFFRAELYEALAILADGHIDQEDMLGSWAGAMGQPQFMPSTFTRYAVDENNDGRKDIWLTLPDVFGSAANYLSKLGWDMRYTWGREVKLPDSFDLNLVGLRIKKSLSEWQAVGIRRIDGNDLPIANIEGALILPGGLNGPAFLVYRNFERILSWNRSLLYALSVGHLADRIIGLGPLQSERNDERALSRQQVILMQKALNAMGHDAGTPDGQAGPQTRSAIRQFQKMANLPADGYPGDKVFNAIIAVNTGK